MTREEQIIEAAEKATYQKPPQYNELVHKSRKVMSAYEVGFIDGCVWADSNPAWIPVEERLPPTQWRDDNNFGMENLCPDNWNGQPDEVNDLWFSAPTQQMALRWLREEKGIHIYPIPVTGFHYVVSVYAEEGNKTYNRILSRSGRHAYEDAVDAALEYCLTNLI